MTHASPMSADNFVCVFQSNYAETVTKNFKSFLDNDLYIDLIFVCRNNKKVGAHQVVFGCLSKFFYSIFLDNMNTAKEKVIHVYVPDIRAKIMKYILEFIYCGKAMLNKGELAEFNDDIKLLGMPLDHFSNDDNALNNPKVSSLDETVRHLRKGKLPSTSSSKDTVDLTDFSSGSQPIMNKMNKTSVQTPAVNVHETVNLPQNAAVPLTSNSRLTEQKVIPTIPAEPGASTTDTCFLPVISSVEGLVTDTVTDFDSKAVSNLDLPDVSPLNSPCPSSAHQTRTKSEGSKTDTKSRSRKRKKQRLENTYLELNERIAAESCINLDASDDDNDVIMIS